MRLPGKRAGRAVRAGRAARDVSLAAAGDATSWVRLGLRLLRSRRFRRLVRVSLAAGGVAVLFAVWGLLGMAAGAGGDAAGGGGAEEGGWFDASPAVWLAYRAAGRVWCDPGSGRVELAGGGEDLSAGGLVRADWRLVAAVGAVESDHGRGRLVNAWGDVSPPIVGPVLDGRGGTAAVGDTDGGRFDFSSVGDRAAGLMQLLPGTVASYGVDGNGDEVVDPHNVWDATATASAYLCLQGAGAGLGLEDALLAYNRSADYAERVLGEYQMIRGAAVPDAGSWPRGAPLGFAHAGGEFGGVSDEVLRSLVTRVGEPGSVPDVDCPPVGGCVWSVPGAGEWSRSWEPLRAAGLGAPLLLDSGSVTGSGEAVRRDRVPVSAAGLAWPLPVSVPPQPAGYDTPGWWSFALPAGSEAWTAPATGTEDDAWAAVLPAFPGGLVYAPAAGEAKGGGGDDDCLTITDGDGWDWRLCGVVPFRVGGGGLSGRLEAFLADWQSLEEEASSGDGAGMVSLGTFNCRRIAGSDTWSQHAFGNAVDIGADLDGDGRRSAAEAASAAGFELLSRVFDRLAASMSSPVRKMMSDGSTLLQDQRPELSRWGIRNAIFNEGYQPGSPVSVVRHDEHIHIDFHHPDQGEEPECVPHAVEPGLALGFASGELRVWLTGPGGERLCPQVLFGAWRENDWTSPAGLHEEETTKNEEDADGSPGTTLFSDPPGTIPEPDETGGDDDGEEGCDAGA